MKFDELVLQDGTRAMLAAMIKDPPHALLLVGEPGFGKRTLAEAWAGELGVKASEIHWIEPDEKGTISIAQVRTLYGATRTKHSGKRVVIIDQAENMGTEAQNALLKLLEEPLPDNILILTAPSTATLLPTIVSRAQIVPVRAISQNASQTLLKNLGVTDPKTVAQMLFMASGRSAELTKLAADPNYFEAQINITTQAKALLEKPIFDRMVIAQQLGKDRELCLRTLKAMQQIIAAGLGKSDSPQKMIAIADSVEQAALRIVQNGNAKAQLLALLTSY